MQAGTGQWGVRGSLAAESSGSFDCGPRRREVDALKIDQTCKQNVGGGFIGTLDAVEGRPLRPSRLSTL